VPARTIPGRPRAARQDERRASAPALERGARADLVEQAFASSAWPQICCALHLLLTSRRSGAARTRRDFAVAFFPARLSATHFSATAVPACPRQLVGRLPSCASRSANDSRRRAPIGQRIDRGLHLGVGHTTPATFRRCMRSARSISDRAARAPPPGAADPSLQFAGRGTRPPLRASPPAGAIQLALQRERDGSFRPRPRRWSGCGRGPFPCAGGGSKAAPAQRQPAPTRINQFPPTSRLPGGRCGTATGGAASALTWRAPLSIGSSLGRGAS